MLYFPTFSTFSAEMNSSKWKGNFTHNALRLIYDFYCYEGSHAGNFLMDPGAVAADLVERPISYYAPNSGVEPREVDPEDYMAYPNGYFDEEGNDVPGVLDQEGYQRALDQVMETYVVELKEYLEGQTSVMGYIGYNPDENAAEWDVMVVLLDF